MAVSAPTLFDRWSEDQKLHRAGCVAAGIEPRLHRFWVSSPTAELEAALAEYRTLPELDDVVAALETEIAYRGAS